MLKKCSKCIVIITIPVFVWILSDRLDFNERSEVVEQAEDVSYVIDYEGLDKDFDVDGEVELNTQIDEKVTNFVKKLEDLGKKLPVADPKQEEEEGLSDVLEEDMFVFDAIVDEKQTGSKEQSGHKWSPAVFDLQSVVEHFEKLIEQNRAEEAYKLAITTLEYWSRRESIRETPAITGLLFFATRINSQYYFDLIYNYSPVLAGQYEEQRDWGKYFRQYTLYDPYDDLYSLSNFLANKCYIDPEILNYNGIDVGAAKEMLVGIFNRLMSKDRRLAEVIKLIGVYAKKDPFFRIDFFAKSKQPDPSVEGMYIQNFKRTSVYSLDVGNISESMERTVAHELTHQLMDILYKNDSKPYNTYRLEHMFDQAVVEARGQISKLEVKEEDYVYVVNLAATLESVLEYKPAVRNAEYIARFSEMLYMNAPRKKVIYGMISPFLNYWDAVIAPEIKKYIDLNADLYTFFDYPLN